MGLTKKKIDKLKAHPTHDIYSWDDKVIGFAVRMKSSGRRTFIIQYRNEKGPDIDYGFN